ncbi:MAG: hypothetical protein EPO13_09880 [Actinomycetota bacterium]|nr:MAG: hypothetical protein EPO13_09880 [Actinomycetota bacterium]
MSATRAGRVRAAALVAAVYLVLTGTVAACTGAWENNDEADHVVHAQQVLRTGLPATITPGNGVEAQQGPLYYYLLAGWQAALRIPAFRPDPRPGPAEGPLEGRPQLLDHTYNARQQRQAEWLRQLRILSVACGLVAVLAAFGTALLLTGRTAAAVAVGLTVGLWPKFVVVNAAVTNSALVEALVAVGVLLWVRWARAPGLGRAAAVGAALGCAVLAQVTALPIAILLLGAMAWRSLRARQWWPPVLAAGVAVAVCGWWFVRNVVLYGDLLATRAATENFIALIGPGLVRNPPELSVTVMQQALPVLYHSTWYRGGWNQLGLPDGLDLALWLLAAVSLVGLLRYRLRGGLPIVLAALGSLISWTLLVRQYTQSEGRYLLVAVSAWAMLLVWGTWRLIPWRSVGLWLWPVALLAADVVVLATWVIPHRTL